MVELKKLTDDNMGECLKLKVSDDQKRFVSENWQSLIEAWLAITNEGYATAYAIYAGDTMVGFIQYSYTPLWPEDPWDSDSYNLWKLMIDVNHQGKGYGKQAILKIIDEMKTMPNGPASYIDVHVCPDNEVAMKLYDSLGFKDSGLRNDDCIVLRMHI